MANMTRSPRLYLEDIRESIGKIVEYTNGMTYDQFVGNDMAIDAVIRNFEIIGEAANRVPSDIKEANSHVPWHLMIGIRNKLVHQYHAVELIIIWETARNDLPPLLPIIDQILNRI